MGDVVEAVNVWKMLGYRWILKGVNIRLQRGKMALIVGPNGSGKSTLLKILGGLWRPTRGHVKVTGKDPASPEAKEKIGIVLHESVLYEEMTVRENLRFYSSFYGGNREKLGEYLETLGISKILDRKVKELSFGWRRRVNIARALLNTPELLIVDEPLTGLDQHGREAVLDILCEIIDSSGTVVAASPTVERELLERAGAEVFTLSNGVIVREQA